MWSDSGSTGMADGMAGNAEIWKFKTGVGLVFADVKRTHPQPLPQGGESRIAAALATVTGVRGNGYNGCSALRGEFATLRRGSRLGIFWQEER